MINKKNKGKALTSEKLKALSETEDDFDKKSLDLRNTHVHKWESAFIPRSFAIPNTRFYKVCFGCGSMERSFNQFIKNIK